MGNELTDEIPLPSSAGHAASFRGVRTSNEGSIKVFKWLQLQGIAGLQLFLPPILYCSAPPLSTLPTTMTRLPAGVDSVVLTSSTAFSICDGLRKMAHCLIVELPEPELREVRYTLNSLLTRTDQVLDIVERDHTLNFDNLRIDPPAEDNPLRAEDFGAVFVSNSSTTEPSDESSLSSSSAKHTKRRVVPAPLFRPMPPVPASSPAMPRFPTPVPVTAENPPTTPAQYHGFYPLVIPSRQGVGFPDYSNHPHFVRPGVPGAYQRPPTASGLAGNSSFYVVSKGLFVGVFTDWDELAPWVLGVSGSIFRKGKSWEEARDLYNARLASGAVQILK